MFERADFERLAAQLAGIAGRFVLSINETPFIRDAFAHFSIEEVATTWSLAHAGAGNAKRVTELIIRN